jgi:hypothetical protein
MPLQVNVTFSNFKFEDLNFKIPFFNFFFYNIFYLSFHLKSFFWNIKKLVGSVFTNKKKQQFFKLSCLIEFTSNI